MNHFNWILWFPSAGTQIRLDTHCIGWFFVEPASSCSAKTFEEGGWSFNTHKLWVSHNPSVYLYIFVWRGREVMANPRVRRESHRRRRLHKGREIHSCFHLWSDAHCSATGSSTHIFFGIFGKPCNGRVCSVTKITFDPLKSTRIENPQFYINIY